MSAERLCTGAVILAAGMGRRLGPFTRRLPKPLLPVNGTPILLNSLDNLAAAGVERATIVVGHLGDEIVRAVGDEHAGMPISYVRSERYMSTNDIYSLWLAREHLSGDTIILQADVFYEPAVLDAMRAQRPDGVIAVARFAPPMNGTVLTFGPDAAVDEIFYAHEQGPGFDLSDKYKTMNLYLLRGDYLEREFVPELDRIVAGEGRTGACFEVALAPALRAGRERFRAADCTDLRWYEIDTHEERRQAEYMFAGPAGRLETIVGQHGGYWRHDVVDHRLLTNAHFPTPALIEELGAGFDALVREYPVGHRTLAELAGDAFGRDPDQLVVGNGSSELIKLLVTAARRALIVPVPGFNEYENAAAPELLVRFALPHDGFELDVDAFADAAREARADLAVVVSPNNPTSIATPPDELRRLARELEAIDCRLVVDESFVDFCPDARRMTLEPHVGEHPNLVILKSVSKVYGVGGIRLGYLLASDREAVRGWRLQLPIWNVNGFAEEFLRILPRHLGDFEASCLQVRAETDRLHDALAAVSGVEVLPADANYVFVRIPEGFSARRLVERLFADHGVLVKDCGGKSMPGGDRYLRVASRTAEHNARFVAIFEAALARGPAEAEAVGTGA